MHYRLYTCSSHEAIDTIEMHVLAKAYRAAWRAMWASDPAGPHLIHALDLTIDFGLSRAQAALPSLSPPARAGEDAADGRAVGPSSVLPHLDPAQNALVAAAAEFACSALRNQLGEAGATSTFDSQVLAVVDILREIEASAPTLAAGHLLHVVGTTPVRLDQIEQRFGPYVASLVAGVKGAWSESTQGSPAQREGLELERLALEGAEVQVLRLAQDLANLRDPQWLRRAARGGGLAEIAARADRLVLADAQLLRRVQAALALWQAIPWALEPGPNPR